MRRALVIIILIFGGHTVFGQDSIVANDVLVLSKVRVGERGLTKSVIDSTQIANSVNETFAELLAKNSPIFVKSYGLGSLATVSFRGTAASHTQVIWNGINVNNPMLGQVDFSTIPVWFIDKTEILYGGSSLTQGAGALGGSVVVGSTPKWDQKVYGSALIGAGSFSSLQTFASIGGGTEKLQVVARYMYDQAKNDFKFYNNAIYPPQYQRQKDADYIKLGATLDIFARLGGNHFLTANGWFFNDRRNLPPIMSYEGKGRDERQTSNEWRGSVKWAFYTDRIKSELVIGYTNTSLDYLLVNKTEIGEIINYDSRSKIQTSQIKYSFDYEISKVFLLKTVVDAQFSDVGILDHITKEGYNGARLDYGASASLHADILPWFSAYALVRYENDGQWMPSIGVQFDPLKGLAIKANASRNFHKPTLNDLYWLPGGNPDLLPEHGYTGDLSASYANFGLTLSVTGYLSYINNWIMWRPSEFRYWTAENVRNVFARGVEVQAKYEKKLGKFDISFSGNYAYTRTSNMTIDIADDQSYNKQLIYIPVHKANLFAELRFFGFFVNYNVNFVGERFTTSSNENVRHKLPEYWLNNLTFGKSWKSFDVQFKIENLFDVDYQAILWRPMPGRNYGIIFKYKFACKR